MLKWASSIHCIPQMFINALAYAEDKCKRRFCQSSSPAVCRSKSSKAGLVRARRMVDNSMYSLCYSASLPWYTSIAYFNTLCFQFQANSSSRVQLHVHTWAMLVKGAPASYGRSTDLHSILGRETTSLEQKPSTSSEHVSWSAAPLRTTFQNHISTA
jgi:hypothetical protein